QCQEKLIEGHPIVNEKHDLGREAGRSMMANAAGVPTIASADTLANVGARWGCWPGPPPKPPELHWQWVPKNVTMLPDESVSGNFPVLHVLSKPSRARQRVHELEGMKTPINKPSARGVEARVARRKRI